MRTVTVAGIAASALLTACVQQQTASVVSSTQGSTLVRNARVTDVRDVVIRGDRSTAAGPVVGGVLDGLAERRMEQAGQTTHATELTVRFDNDDVHTYQIEPDESFHVGDRVTVTTSIRGTRITH